MPYPGPGWKLFEDAVRGWQYDDITTLTVRYADGSQEDLQAEIYHEPVFGFSRRPVRTIVRLQVDAGRQLPAREGITLYEKDKPYGDEKAWRVREARRLANENRVDLWLEN